jgi:hypothetical protein
MPWRDGGTLWKIEVWHGSVIEGITLCARMVLAPRAISAFKFGVPVAAMASGRTPSSMKKTVVMVFEA